MTSYATHAPRARPTVAWLGAMSVAVHLACAGAVSAEDAVAIPTPRPTPVVRTEDIETLGQRLAAPIAGLGPAQIQDTFAQPRGARRHEATDIVAARGTPVLAVDDGVVAKLFTSVPGGLTVYQFSVDGTWSFYYAHLDRYVDGLREGVPVRRGELLGYVGTSGNAGTTPHLHFAIFKLGSERRWWEGTPIDPYPLLRAAAARSVVAPTSHQ